MNYSYYMDLIRCALSGTAPSEDAVSAVALEDFYYFSALNKLTPLTTNLLPHWNTTTENEKALLTAWKAESAASVFLEYKKFSLIRSLVAQAKQSNLFLLFFKGYILADLYPDFALRTSSDTDLYVPQNQSAHAFELLGSLGYSRVKELDKKNVTTFLYEEDGVPVHKIELHTSLFEDLQGPRIAYLEQLQLAAPEKAVSVPCCGITLTTMPHTEHLIYQIFHIEKHLSCHGFPARYLIDVALFLRQYHPKIDWNLFYTAIDRLGYTKLCHRLFSVLIREFDIPEAVLCGRSACTTVEAEELLLDILHFGARSYPQALSDFFYDFEQYIERLEQRLGTLLPAVTFDGSTVPIDLVPLEYQQHPLLQQRIGMLRTLELI